MRSSLRHGNGIIGCGKARAQKTSGLPIGLPSGNTDTEDRTSPKDKCGAVLPSLSSQSQSHFLPQAEKFVLDAPYRTLAGRRPYKLGVFLAPETGEGTI